MALLTILDYATAVAVGAATSQQANLEALLAPFGAGPVTARLEGPTGTHLRTLTIPLPSIEATTPRRFTLAAHLADAAVATGAPGRWVFRTSGGLSVFSIPAGTGGSSINHAGAVKTLCTPTLQGVVVTAPAGLPAAPAPALQTFIGSLTPGVWTRFPSPTLTSNDSTGSWPFAPVPGIGTAGIFDWCSSLNWDEITMRMVIIGGRPFWEPGAAKLIVYDAGSDAWSGKADPLGGVPAGHIYQHNAIAPSLRRLIFSSQDRYNRFELLDIDTLLPASPATVPPVPGSNIGPGKPAALVYMPNSGGPLGQLHWVAEFQGVRAMRWRWDFGTGAALGNDFLDGTISDSYGNDQSGFYVPAAGAAIVGRSEPTAPRRLLIMQDNGVMRWTAGTVPFCFGVTGFAEYKCSASAHPSRGAAVIVCGITMRTWTYEIGSDTAVDRGSAPAWAANRNHAMWTIPEWDGLVAIVGSGNSTVADEMWAMRVGSSLG